MLTGEIRKAFLDYFAAHNHERIPSAPVIPHDDPSIMFTNAGMNQFKDVFLGSDTRAYARACSSQKCIRVGGKHNDLDNVGHTDRHMTFFEMLGNFSFGDYFKKEAIDYAWDVAMNVYGFPEERVHVSIYESDDEAHALWEKHLPASRIVRMGAKDNFWSMGDTGPCGPCSELFFDRGERFGSATNPKEDLEEVRFIEFWNLVFMQYNQTANGKQTPLQKTSIDTGSGLERVAMLKAGVDSVFETDILRSLIAAIENLSGRRYESGGPLAPTFHVIADHLRALSFAIADGAVPSNVERGYVLRKILRRAIRYSRGLELKEPFLTKLVPTLINLMGSDYPELTASQSRIEELLFEEETAFLQTLKRGGNILQSIIERSLTHKQQEITGKDAFKLKDTYGFPLEEILLIARDYNLSVNLESFELLEQEARERSKRAHKSHTHEVNDSLYRDFVDTHGECRFTGYDSYEEEASIIGLVKEGALVEALSAGEEGLIILDKTPFYPEKGGQVGDRGTIVHNKAYCSVRDCTAPYSGVIAHYGLVERGTLIPGEPVTAAIDIEKRVRTMRNHTATHLLNEALTQTLGSHIQQAGSLVDEDKLRFDFTHHKSLSETQLRAIESQINTKILENLAVATEEIPYSEAREKSHIKQFFGEKYAQQVRVVSVGDFSHELCGGTHVERSGEIGLFKITKESAVAKGIRRIEAVSGHAAYEVITDYETQLSDMSQQLGVPFSKLSEAFHKLLEENKTMKLQLKAANEAMLSQKADELLANAQQTKGIRIIAAPVDLSQEQMQTLAEKLCKKEANLALLLAAAIDGKCRLVLRIGAPLIERGLAAGALIKEIAPIVDGSGGGKKESAQAGGKAPNNIPQALTTFIAHIEKQC